MIICLCLLFAGRASAQWVVSDPGNLAQGIINASKNIIHTSKTATNMVSTAEQVIDHPRERRTREFLSRIEG